MDEIPPSGEPVNQEPFHPREHPVVSDQPVTMNFAANAEEETAALTEEVQVPSRTSPWQYISYLLIAAVLAGGGYWFYNTHKPGIVALPPATSVPKDWVTFQSKLNPFSVKFPNTWTTQESTYMATLANPDPAYAIVIYTNRATQRFYDEYLKLVNQDPNIKILYHRTMKIGTLSAEQTEVDTYISKTSSQREYIANTDITSDNTVYTISMMVPEDSTLLDKQQIYATLVSSFLTR